MLHNHGRGDSEGGGGHDGLAGGIDLEELVLGPLRFDGKVAGLASGNAMARLQGLQGGEGDVDLRAWLAWPQAGLVDHNLLDGGGVVLLRHLKEKK
jgi:hypothetical protein